MKILMVNKFLYPNGGSETYIFKLGDYLQSIGHEVQYFGMQHKGRCVGNRVNAYTKDMDFHTASKAEQLKYPIRTIYNADARKKIRLVLDDFVPDVVHLNNFNYQLTPSIIEEIVKWRIEAHQPCEIVYTAHDYQLVCPNHMLNNPNTHKNCNKCLGGHFGNCIKGKCIHGSMAKSAIGAAEAEYWNKRGIYRYIDTIICPSKFMKKKLDTNSLFKDKTVVLHNFIDKVELKDVVKKDYVFYFGRYTEEKGVKTLIEAIKTLPTIPFVFAGKGPLDDVISSLPNVKNIGFQSGKTLDKYIEEARFSLCPTEVNENCSFAVMESEERGTPVIGSKVGGNPELIQDGITGRLFTRGKDIELASIIKELWEHPEIVDEYRKNCLRLDRDGLDKYSNKLLNIYQGGGNTLMVFYKASYVLFFGRFSEEKGVHTLIKAAEMLPDIHFVFAGQGPLEEEVKKVVNIKDVGFQIGEDLQRLIAGARFSVYPSEWYENCPFSVMESQMYGTPVLGAKIGGIPELIQNGKTGELFKSGDVAELVEKIQKLWNNEALCKLYNHNCKAKETITLNSYTAKLMNIYRGFSQ